MALDTTPGGASADSFASLAEANAYHATHLYNTAWDAASDADKEAGLIMAARLLDAMPRAWTGAASTETQALGWPRTGMFSRNGFSLASGEVPIDLKNAQAEFARQLISGDLTATNAVIAQGITEIKAGPVGLKFNSAAMDQIDALLNMVPDAVIALLVPSWLKTEADVRDEEDRTGLVIEVL